VDETLHYNLNWPGGVALGEAQMEARRAGKGWNFRLTLQGAIPGFAIEDRYTSQTNAALCTELLEKDSLHGKRRASETTKFDSAAGKATRTTTIESGPEPGSSQFAVPGCVHDALGYIYSLRRLLARSGKPTEETVYFGAAYRLRLTPVGAETLTLDAGTFTVDRFRARLKGPASEASFDLYFAREPARRLVLARLPLAMGAFTMELVR
jgi:hypothetical protein